jgi:hypothetical protein
LRRLAGQRVRPEKAASRAVVILIWSFSSSRRERSNHHRVGGDLRGDSLRFCVALSARGARMRPNRICIS